MSEIKPVYAAPTERSLPWEFIDRAGTGRFVAARSGALLFRVELTEQVIYVWDKKAGREVPVRIRDLFSLDFQSPVDVD